MDDVTPTGQTFRDVVVVPYTDLLDRWRDGEIHRGGPFWPDWDAQTGARHSRGGRAVDARPSDPEGVVAEAGPMAWGGAIVDAFGHQVADFCTRLLATLAARPELPIAFATRPDLGYVDIGSAPSYFRAILEWLGVPADQVRLITAPTRISELFVAAQAEQLSGPGPSAAYLDALDRLASQRMGLAPERDERLLYVSRAGMEARFAGEAYVEKALRRAGVRILRPETEPLAEQLRQYRTAANLVFAEGSALHALQLLGRLDADVSVLERRPGTRLAEANLRPRLRALAYEEVATRLLHGLLPTGRMALPKGLSVADPERLLDVFGKRGVDLRSSWDEVAWSTARDADVLRWVETQAAQPGHLGVGSVEHILGGLDEAGLEHLGISAAQRLEPLNEHLAAATDARTAGRPTLLFMHIPRSAGGAVRAVLHEAIPAAQRRDVYAGSTMDMATFAALPDGERAGLAAVIGDFGYGLHELVPEPARYAVMLRHPIGRIISLYRAAGMPGPSLESWVFDDQRIEADNAMVRAISGRAGVPFGACPDDLLDEAIEHIEADFDPVLVRGNMNRSAVLLGQALGMTLPPLPIVNADSAGEDALDPPKPVRKRLRGLNRLDVALFRRYSEGF